MPQIPVQRTLTQSKNSVGSAYPLIRSKQATRRIRLDRALHNNGAARQVQVPDAVVSERALSRARIIQNSRHMANHMFQRGIKLDGVYGP